MKKLISAVCGAFLLCALPARADTARVAPGCFLATAYSLGGQEPIIQTPQGRGCMVIVGADALATAQATAGTTATLVAPARQGRIAATITNLGTTDTFCGAAGVTTTTGTILLGSKGAALTIPTSAAIYCVVATGTQSVSVLETY